MGRYIIWQNSRALWFKDGDASTRYFHTCHKRRLSFNRIDHWKSEDGGIIDNEDEVKAKLCSSLLNYW